MGRIESTKTQFYLWNIGRMIHILIIHETRCNNLVSFRHFNLLIHYLYRLHPFSFWMLESINFIWIFPREAVQGNRFISLLSWEVLKSRLLWRQMISHCKECDVDLRICFWLQERVIIKKWMRKHNYGSNVSSKVPSDLLCRSELRISHLNVWKQKYWTPFRDWIENRIQ